MDPEDKGMRAKKRGISPAEDELLNRVRMLESELTRTKRLLNILENSEVNINVIADSEMSAVIVMRSNGEIAFWNKAAERLFGYTQKEMIGKELHKVIAHDQYKEAYRKGIEKFAKTGKGIAIGKTLKLIAVRKGGENIPVKLTLNSSKVGNEWLATGVVRDLRSDKKKTIMPGKASDTATLVVEEASPEAVIIMDSKGKISFWDQAARDIFGYSPEEIIGKTLHKTLAPERFHDRYSKAMKKFKKSGEGDAIGRTIELVGIRKNGEEFPIELSLTSVKMGEEWVAIGIIRDYSDRYEIEKQLRMTNEELEILATTDSLTGVANRYKFEERYRHEWECALRQSTPLSLVFADIDNFKIINDTYGHQVGDIFLKSIAEIFRANVQRVSDLIARYGGEEFVVLLPNTELRNAEELAEKIRMAVEDHYQEIAASKVPLNVTISLGVSCVIPRNTIRKDELVAAADKALYKAKANGRNQVSTLLIDENNK
jgi:diguanylate cyclase (GGDEF)-like protein/PAS domain S-box-containing protein